MLPMKEKSQNGENEKEFKRKPTCFLVIFLLQNAKFASKICQKHQLKYRRRSDISNFSIWYNWSLKL
jgi:hypothetical protein